MNVTYRSIRADEIPVAIEVFLAGLTAYAQRHGLPAPTSYTPAVIQPLYRHIFDTGIFEVAEEGGRIVTIACGIVRGELFFLSMFWALPEYRGRGIGRPLLDRVFAEGQRRGATVQATWSSLDFTAMGTYFKRGLLPGATILTFAGAPRHVPGIPGNIRLQALESSSASFVDRAILGLERPMDHAYFMEQGTQGFQVDVGGELAGYFYVKGGVIGPAAWLRPEHGATILSAALNQAAAHASEVKIVALGINETALRVAVDSGLKVIGMAHWLRSAPFGKLDRYVPSGPALF